MANRTSVDLSGIRERIEKLRPDSAWKELSLSKKIKLLLKERLEQGDSRTQANDEGEKEDIAHVLTKLANNIRPDDNDLIFAAQALGIETEKLYALRDRLFSKQPNGNGHD